MENGYPKPLGNAFNGVMAEMLDGAKRRNSGASNASSRASSSANSKIGRSASLRDDPNLVKRNNLPQRSATLKIAGPESKKKYQNVMNEMLKKKIVPPEVPKVPEIPPPPQLTTGDEHTSCAMSETSGISITSSAKDLNESEKSSTIKKNKTPPNKPIRRNSQRSLKSRHSSGNQSPNSASPGSNPDKKAESDQQSVKDSSHERIQGALPEATSNHEITCTNEQKNKGQTRLTPLRKEKDERRANYEKRRDQRRRSVHSSDQEAKKEIPKLTSTPKKTKKPKQIAVRRLSTVKNDNDEASPTESELQNKETKSSQTTLERRNMLRSLPLSSSSSDESAIESIVKEEPVFATFMAKPKLQNGQDNDSSHLSQKIAKLKEDEYAKRQHELNSSLVIKIDPEVDIETEDSSTDEDSPFIKSKTGEFTYLNADEELLEPFEKLGWFSGRPNYYYAENIFIWLYGLNSVVNWLFVMMALAKGIIGMIAMKNAFIFQVAFSGLGLLHLTTLPLLDNFEFIQKSKQLLRHSRTSKFLRKVLSNWENRFYYYVFNFVQPWNTLVFCRNYNGQRRVLEAQLDKTSTFVTRLTQQKIKNLKIIQDRLLFTSSCYRDPFQFFIGYNLLIQIAGSEASSFAVSSEDIDKYYYDMLLFGVCSLSMMLNLFYIFLNVTQRIGAWYEAQTGKDLQYGSRTLYLVSATCQSLIVLLFCNLEHEQFFRDHKFLRSSIHEGILAAKVFGLFVINIVIFSIHVTTFENTAKQSKWTKTIIIFRRSFSSILFWTQDINNDKTILPAKDIVYFVFYMLLRIIYIVVLWVFVDQVFLDSEGLYQIPDLTALDTRHNIFISVMIIATLICILAQILLYFVLKDGEFCKKILLYLMTFIFFSSIVLGMFLLLPRSNSIFKSIIDFNPNLIPNAP